jgi:hypothetical protein
MGQDKIVMNGEYGKELTLSVWRYYTGICFEGLRKTKGSSDNTTDPMPGFKLGTSKKQVTISVYYVGYFKTYLQSSTSPRIRIGEKNTSQWINGLQYKDIPTLD